MIPTGSYSWFAVRVKPRHEKVVERAIQSHVIDCYLPLYRVRHKWADRYKDLALPLFPGYLFCRFGLESKTRVLTCPGVLGIVGFGHTPVPLDDDEIAALHRLTTARDVAFGPWKYLKTGDLVEVVQGALAGLRGILIQVKNGVRVIVSVSLLQRSIAIEIDRDCLMPATPRRPSVASSSDLSARRLSG